MNDPMAGHLAQVAPKTLHDLLEAVARKNPAARAVADMDSELSYAALLERVDAYAKGLLAAGVQRGDRVAMLTPPSIDFWIVYHAAASIGAIWLGINPRYQSRDFEYVLGDSDPAVLITCSPFDGRDYCTELRPFLKAGVPMVCHGEPTAGALSLAAFLTRGAEISDARLAAARAAVTAEDIALIVYTSGTTGKPKGAMLSHRAIVSLAVLNASWMGSDALARALCAAPANHVGGINNCCMCVLAGGGTIIFHPRVDMVALGQLSLRERPTYLVASPTSFSMTLSGGGDVAEYFTCLRLIVFGGATTPRSILEQIAQFGPRLASVYGMTETCGISTRTNESDDLEVLSVTVGKALPGLELRVAGPDGSVCATGETGEIQVKGTYVMSGYFRNPQATAEAFTADGYLRTGDLALVREDGNLVVVGRLKEMFKSGGYNIYPIEIEQAICEHPAVAQAAVVPISHPVFQEVGFAFVQPRLGGAVTADELRDFLRKRIANYKIPKHFCVEAELPTLPTLKIDKVTLKTRAASLSRASGAAPG
ncbi:MAG TPA: class I adenylate-forming enzyme family protein [Candidatus Acidoferrales bacterium]|nr:class I adenylate-forming enzyme family protein [Candidatus Acidoferrales bacterium]